MFYVCLSSKGDIYDILHGILNKIELFEVEMPFYLAEKGLAL